ncbi:hypothetical protein MMC11_005913 [Xylographa trunciseda]|nr:hypothetical protein [Xylographa trunciseda]
MDSNEYQAGGHPPDNPAGARIYLNILSPSSEVPQKLTYPDISTSTTIHELKRRIQNDIETRPGPERQRLIYRGRALVQEEKTLEDIFGREAVQGSDVFSLHLVLSPLQTQAPYNIPTSHSRQPANTNIPPERPTGLPPLPAGTAALPPRPASTGQLPANIGMRPTVPNPAEFGPRPQPNGMPWQGIQFPQGHLPGPMQELLNAHLTALAQPLAGQPNLPAFSSGHGHTHIHNHANPWQHPTPFAQFPGFPQQNLHPILAQQQQAQIQQQQALIQQQQAHRAASGQHGISATPAPLAHNPDPATVPLNQLERGPLPTNGLPTRVGTPGTSSTIIREGQGANGAQWRVVINQSTTTLTPPGTTNQLPPAPMAHPGATLTAVQGTLTPSTEGLSSSQSPHTTELNAARQSVNSLLGRDSYWPNSPLAIVQQRLSQLERYLDQRSPPSNGDILQVRNQLQNLRSQQPDLPPGLEISLNTRLNNISIRVAHMRTQMANSREQTTNGTSTVFNASVNPSTNTMVYLLSSPAGPHALLVAPSGIYGTSTGADVMSPPVINTTSQGAAPVANQILVPNDVPVFHNEQEIRDIQVVQAEGQQQQEQQPDQVGDLARVLLPLGGHLWLLIRLFGFVYFFTSGAGWHRTVLLCTCAIVVFIGQTGVFRPIQQALWDPVRRHIEGLVPLAGNNGDAGANNDRGVAEGQGPTGPLPTPQQLAERLLRERNDQDSGMVRRNIRRIERATALFVASLVPGVGERHIAARDAAEAARQAAMEREEQVRRDEEAGEQVEGPEEGNNGDDAFADAEEGVVPPLANTGQQPLVEI